MPAAKLLGDDWISDEGIWKKETTRAEAADVLARLRKVSIGGNPIEVEVRPSLKRNAVRQGRLEEARRRRDGSVGFSRPGAKLDTEGRFSLTPEKIAYTLGKQADGATVIDACCGAGGNAIGFARAGCRVIAIDTDASRLKLARHNAKVYGVERDITFLHGDAKHLYQEYQAQLLFIDPPWGEWDTTRCTLDQFPVLAALTKDPKVHRHVQRIWAKVPSSFDPKTLANATPEAMFGVNPGDRRHIKFLLLRPKT